MLFGTPTKLPDGRYFLKATDVFHQINGVKFSLSADDQVTLGIPEGVNLFSEIDDAIIAQAKASKVEWFGKEIADETVDTAYQKSVNPERELSATLAKSKGKVLTTFYDTEKNVVAPKDIQDRVVDIMIELAGLVFTKRAFEPVWRVVQVRVKAPPKVRFPKDYLFTDDPVEEEEELDL